MIKQEQEPKSTRLNGNIWGWRFSLYSLAIILITLIAALILDDPTKNDSFFLQKNDKKAIDSIQLIQKEIENR